MRRWIVAALLLLCLPVVGRGQSIRYYPDSTSYTLGKTESGILYRAASANPTLLDGLVSYWTLDEASGTRADSVGSNDLTDNNTVGAKLRGPEGTVAKTVYANSEWLGRTLTLDYSQGVTLSIWFYQATGASVQGRFAQHGGAYYYGGTGGFSLSDGNSTPNLYAGFGDNASIVSATTQSSGLNSWHHVVMWYDPADKKARMRLDGQAVVASASGLANHPNPAAGIYNDFVISRETVVGVYTDGQFGPTGLWNRLLTTDEQDALFADGNGARYADIDVGASCIGWWELDEVSGVRYDSHGSNDLTDNNTVSSETAVPGAMNNAAASLVAANSEKLNRTGVNFGFTDFSISLWAKTPVSAAAYQEYVCKNNTIDFDLRSYDANYVQFNVNGSSAQIQTDTNWHLIVAYYVHSEKKAYLTIDAGVPTAGAAGTGLSETTSELAIGAATSSYNNNGLIDEVAIWDRVLTSDRITELWNAGAGVYYPTFQ